MNRDEREQAIWHDAYMLAMSQDPSPAESSCLADAAVAEFRKRYPVEPTAPPAVWYYEPPFAKDGKSYRCWVAGWGLNRTTVVAELCWYDDDWRMQIVGSRGQYLLAGRRVCPIAKPQEPPQ